MKCIDYDDLVIEMGRPLPASSAALPNLQGHLEQVLVDEWQDETRFNFISCLLAVTIKPSAIYEVQTTVVQ